MTYKIRPYRNTDKLEVDITVRLPDGRVHRERKKSPVASKSGTERWRPVVGYEGHYEVSDLGRVRGLRTGRVLKPNAIGRYGHQQVKLRMLGKTRD